MSISTNGVPPDDENYNGEATSEDDLTDSSESEVEELGDEECATYFNERNRTLFHVCRNSPYPLPVDANELAVRISTTYPSRSFEIRLLVYSYLATRFDAQYTLPIVRRTLSRPGT
jgi:hypothetical protein